MTENGKSALDQALDKLTPEEKKRLAEQAVKVDQRSSYTANNGIIEPLHYHDAVVPKMYGALDLMAMDVPPMQWIIDGVLPVGITHFAGKEKSFKSFAALGLCAAASRGAEYLGFDVKRSEALLFDLESSELRPHNRIKSMQGSVPINNDYYIITGNNLKDEDDIPITLDNGFTDTLRAILNEHEKINLVVIDVFNRIRSKRKNGEDFYSWDYRDVTQLKAVADAYGIAIVIVNHIVKSAGLYKDDFDTMRGAGINAAVDCIWLLKKDSNSDYSGTLKIKGRDVESQEYEIQFDSNSMIWTRRRTESDILKDRLRKSYELSNIRQTVAALTTYRVTWTGTASELIQASYKTNTAIGVNAKQLGMDLKKYEHLLREDGFTFYKMSKKYTFTNKNHSNNNKKS